MKKIRKCCICKKPMIEYGNNALPIMAGACCNKCNREKVIPARLASCKYAMVKMVKQEEIQ